MDRALMQELISLLPNCLRQDRARLQASLARCVGRARPEQLQHLLLQAQRSIELRHRRHERLPQVSYPAHLPITAKRDEIVAAIRAHPVVIIAGETGSGKTTQIPKMCLQAGLGVEGKIGCTQPRRVAALSISRRIAEELGVRWGQEVGCKIRFSDRSSTATCVKLMTDGILLAETQGDRDLDEYDAIVIDEAHERSLNIDFLLGHLKLLLARRRDLKLIITSATINTEAFSQAFDGAPVIEVSGRTFPMEIRYAPHDAEAEESGDLTYIDAAVNAVEDVLLESERGDILIFMPSERDIRETQDDLQGRYGGEAEIVPLFGRLTAGEQDRVFAASLRRKIIVSTNIAETSLTIPGVRYVIDTGLARLSRYSPRTRTRRLPIEPISQSSAKQRAGRCGRVEHGVCIRLYSQEDFAGRAEHTQPEIQRANLAEVILKMKAWRLGEMETFPFINPPQPQAIQSGYQLLQELGALDEDKQLTALGRDLARLPVDPAMGRMILQSVREGALTEVLVVAAGLSIQDPRERPLDRQEAADQAHRRFLHADSDFLTLLNLWNAYDTRLESLKTQNQMRKFCRANFISYVRMREWIDIHAQLEEALETMVSAPLQNPKSKIQNPYAAIHRSILSGLLGHIAQRVERNLYKASANRQIMLWPGSSLFERTGDKGRKGGSHNVGRSEKAHQPEWVVAGEMVETSRLFGRTVAGIEAEWIAELGAHICKRSYGEPFWDGRIGRVLSRERTTLFGLLVQELAVDYGRVNPSEATQLFIRAALIEGQLDSPHPFLAHNRKLREKLEVWRSQQRDHHLPNLDDAFFEFYTRRLENVSSVHDLNRVVRERMKKDSRFLCADEADLTGGAAVEWNAVAFPNTVLLAEEPAGLEYAYAPGQEHDGITVKLPAALAQRVEPAMLDWVVPGLRAEQIEFLIKSLPKSIRVPLMPIAPKVAELASCLDPATGIEGLRALIQERYGVAIPPNAWKRESLPAHLRPRVAITAPGNKILATSRDLESLKQDLAKHQTPAEQQAWANAVQRWERYDLRGWTFGDLPEQIDVLELGGVTLRAFPGLETDGHAIHLKLFRKRNEAEGAARSGFICLIEQALHKDLAWLQKDLRGLEKAKDLYLGWLSTEELLASAYECLRTHLITPPDPMLPLRQSTFEAARERVRAGIPGLASSFVDQVVSILRTRSQILRHRAFTSAPEGGRPALAVAKQLSQLPGTPTRTGGKVLPFLSEELNHLVPKEFLTTTPWQRLSHLPRYLKALAVRADRALSNPAKDVEKAAQVQPYVDALRRFDARQDLSPETKQAFQEYRWLVEEFKVSIFAQEIGTAQPVSPQRLDAQLKRLG
jgi:ATP-dependent helicase HrpA